MIMKYLKLSMHSLSLDSNQNILDHLFPFHFIINDKLIIDKSGRSLIKLLGNCNGMHFYDYFKIQRPGISIDDFDKLKSITNKLVILAANHDSDLLFRGELITIDDSNEILFCGSPWFANSRQLMESGLEISDFSIQDPMIDMLYLIQSKEIDYADLQALLKRTREQKEELAIANANLKKHAKDLANSNSELERFAYSASHDLQEPLRMVTSFLNLLEKKYVDIVDEAGKRYIEFAVNGATRMRDMIVDLLEYSRVGRSASNLENIDINSLMEDIIKENELSISQQKVEIEYYNLPTIKNYRSPITQVFQTLIDFGIENSKGNYDSKIQITCENFDNCWRFCIKDNGKGIEPELLKDIFLIFKTRSMLAKPESKLSNLPIIKKIIENQGGEISVNSDWGQGTEFYFTVPINQ